MRKSLAVLGVALALALASDAFAGGKREKPERVPPTKGTGLFVSATVAGDVSTWKLTMEGDEPGEKTFELTTNVVVTYTEKNGVNMARQLRRAGKKAPEPKGKMLVATGTLVKAEAQDNKVAVTLKVGDAEQQFLMTKKMTVTYRAADNKNVALGFASAGGGRKGEGGGKKGEGGGGKKNKVDKAPDNF